MNKKSSFTVAAVLTTACAILLTSGCYRVQYDSRVFLSGVVQSIDGTPQRVDLNDGISICVAIHLNHPVYHDKSWGQRNLTLCNVLTTANDGRFEAVFQLDSPTSGSEDLLAIGKRETVDIESARTYLTFKESTNSKLVGEVNSFSKLSADQYTASAKFVLNRSQYQPDTTIEVNSTQKPYRK